MMFPPLAVVDVPAVVGAVRDRWLNLTLCRVNESVLRLGVMQGGYHHRTRASERAVILMMETANIVPAGGA